MPTKRHGVDNKLVIVSQGEDDDLEGVPALSGPTMSILAGSLPGSSSTATSA